MTEIVTLSLWFLWYALLLVMIPISLLVATPFILLWPRKGREQTYLRTVLGRYRKMLNIIGTLAGVGATCG